MPPENLKELNLEKSDAAGDGLKEDDSVIAQQLREGQPMWITNKFVERPCCILILGLLILFVLTVASFGLGYFTLNDSHPRDFLIWDDEITRVYDLKMAAIDEILASKGDIEQSLRI
jgi:hypothetical protein